MNAGEKQPTGPPGSQDGNCKLDSSSEQLGEGWGHLSRWKI